MTTPKRKAIVVLCVLVLSIAGFQVKKLIEQQTNRSHQSFQSARNIPDAISDDKRESSNGKNPISDAVGPLSQLDKLRAELEIARSKKSITERAQACRDVIEQMCKSGFVDEAFSLISSSPGLVRTAELNAFFANCNLPLQQAAAILNSLPYKNEILLNVGNLLSGASFDEALEFAKSAEIRQVLASTEFASPEELIGNSLASYFSQVTNDTSLTREARENALLTAKKWHESGLLSNANLGTVLYNDTSSPAIVKWQILSEINTDSSGGIVGEPIRHKLLEALVVENAEEALPFLTKKFDQVSLNDLEYAFGIHATVEPSRALAWYEQQSGVLSQTQIDKLAVGFFQAALRNAEYDSAESWLSKISDVESREALRSKIPVNP